MSSRALGARKGTRRERACPLVSLPGCFCIVYRLAVSKGLAERVAFLARSLGARSSSREKEKGWRIARRRCILSLGPESSKFGIGQQNRREHPFDASIRR